MLFNNILQDILALMIVILLYLQSKMKNLQIHTKINKESYLKTPNSFAMALTIIK